MARKPKRRRGERETAKPDVRSDSTAGTRRDWPAVVLLVALMAVLAFCAVAALVAANG